MSGLSLEIVEGADAGRQVPLSGPVVLGRGDDADVRVSDARVSRRHARVTPGDGAAMVEDLESANGTLIDGVVLQSPARWDPGEDLVIGTTVIELRTAAAVAAQPSAVRPVPPQLAAPPREPTYVPPPASSAHTDPDMAELDALIDVRTRSAARTAPLALFVLVVLAVIVFLALR